MIEEWKAVSEFPAYEISNFGHLRRWTGKKYNYLKGYIHEQGYRVYGLSKDGIELGRFAHRLVALSFLELPSSSDKVEVCHNNGEPLHNFWMNLRWDTRSNNMLDIKKHGTFNSAMDKETVLQIRKEWESIKHIRGAIKTLSIKYNRSYPAMRAIVLRQSWQTV